MVRLDAVQGYLLKTLPRDMKVAIKIIVSKKLEACVILLSVMALTVLVSLLAMWVTTGNLPSVAVNTDYWGLAFQRLRGATVRELPATLVETLRIYLGYPAIWFTFERIGFEEQARTLAMDTTTVFPVINLRYLLDNAPIGLLLTFYMVLSRYRARGMRPVRSQKATQILSISLPSGGSAMGSALAPMACCGGTAVQSVASVMGFVATAPAAILVSRLSVVAVATLLILGIARTARKICGAGTVS